MDISRRPAQIETALTPARDRAVSVLMLVFWALVTIWQQWGHWAEDLAAVYIAGWLWHAGLPDLIYAAPKGFFGGAAAEWFPVMDQIGIGGQTSFPYVYPPLWAVLTGGLTSDLTAQGFFNAVTLFQVPMLAGSVLLAARILKPPAMPLWVWTAVGLLVLNVSIQSHVAIWYNQPTITVTFLTLLAFERLGADRPVAAGIALAFAAALKLSPAAFALIFLVDRQYRALAVFAVAGGALGALSIALAGWPLHDAFLARLSDVSGSGFLIAINVSVKTALLAAGSAIGLLEPVDIAASEHVYRDLPAGLGALLALSSIALALLTLRSIAPLPGPARRGIGLLALSIMLALFGPLGWLHYYLLPMFLLPGLIGVLSPPRAALLLASVWVPSLSFVFSEIGILPWPVANYVWLMCAAWLAVFAAALGAARNWQSERA